MGVKKGEECLIEGEVEAILGTEIELPQDKIAADNDDEWKYLKKQLVLLDL